MDKAFYNFKSAIIQYIWKCLLNVTEAEISILNNFIYLIYFYFSTKRKTPSTSKKKEALNSLLKVSKIALEDIFSLDTEQCSGIHL